jgi:hypothetical protein
MYRQSAYTLGQKDESKGNSLDLHLYNEKEGWKHINKKASDSAEFKQLHKAMQDLSKKAKKAGWKFRINLWYQGELRTALICKEWSL